MRNPLIINTLCKIFNSKCICTTRSQYKYFSKSIKDITLVRIVEGFEITSTKERKDGSIIFFGRLEQIKNIRSIINIFLNAQDKLGLSKLYIVGEGSIELKESSRVRIIRKWLTKAELKKIIEKCDFVVNATHEEGYSLQIFEGISSGLYPLVSSSGLLYNYNLKDCHTLTELNLVRAYKLSNEIWSNEIKEIQKNLIEYLEMTPSLTNYIKSIM